MIQLSSVYLAGSWADRARLRGVRADLEKMGVTCTARWLDYDDEPLPSKPIRVGDHLANWAAIDLFDIDQAHTLILFTDVPSTAGGFHFEAGYAFGNGMNIIGVGPRTMLCHHLIDDWFDSFDALRAQIAPREVANV